MKLSFYLTSFYLAGLGLTFTIPAVNETDLLQPPRYEDPAAPLLKVDTLDKRAGTGSHKKAKHSEKGHSKNSHAASGGHCVRGGKQGHKHAHGTLHRRNPLECAEEWISFGNKWRTPTKKEAEAIKIKKPARLTNGNFYHTTQNTFAPNLDEHKKPIAKDCEFTSEHVAEHKMNFAHADSSTFYSRVHGIQYDFATEEKMDFQFETSLFKPEAKEWVKNGQGCHGFWPRVSKAFALQAHGHVHVLLPSKAFEVGQLPVWPAHGDTVWAKDEFPTLTSEWKDDWQALLQENKKACFIWRWVVSAEKHLQAEPDLIALRTGHECGGHPFIPVGDYLEQVYDWAKNTLKAKL